MTVIRVNMIPMSTDVANMTTLNSPIKRTEDNDIKKTSGAKHWDKIKQAENLTQHASVPQFVKSYSRNELNKRLIKYTDSGNNDGWTKDWMPFYLY